MARFTLGGKTFVIGELNFLAVERAWPYITDAMVSQIPSKASAPDSMSWLQA
jgi:hypothetical protein